MNIAKKFLTLAALLITLNAGSTAFAYPKPVAIISNYDEIADGIQIHRAAGSPSGSSALLYPGDAITGNVGYVLIERGPYADFHARNGAYVISYNPPSGISAVAKEAIDYAGSFWNNVENVVTGASRGNDKLNLKPQPGFDVTLLMNETVHFAWEGSAVDNFVINSENGSKIFEKAGVGGGGFDLKVDASKFKAGQKYLWSVGGNSYSFSVLNDRIEKEVRAGFAAIDAEKISVAERTLKKAAYVQLISDLYPDKVDLYWLSAQWLEKISPSSKQMKDERSAMLKKCAQHLDEEM